jgi:hypothetical protein
LRVYLVRPILTPVVQSSSIIVKMVSNFLSFFHLCTLQTIGGGYDFLNIVRPENEIPVLVDRVDKVPLSRYVTVPINTNGTGTRSVGGFREPGQRCLRDGTATVIFTEWIPNPKILMTIFQTLNKITSLEENPRYILIEFSPKYYRPHPRPFVLNLNGIALTSSYFVFHQSQRLLHLCFNCAYSRKRDQLEEVNENMNEFLQQDKNRELDFGGGFANVISLSLNPSKHRSRRCSLYHDRLSTPCIDCTLSILTEKYNFTVKTSNDETSNRIGFLTKYHAAGFLNSFLANYRMNQFVWAIHGITFDRFQFVVFTDGLAANAGALLSPLDWKTWICTALSFVIFICFTGLGILRLQKKIALVLWAISTVFEQTEESHTKELFGKLPDWKSIVVIASWWFTMFFLGIIYQGALFSGLAATGTPDVPSSLVQILKTDIPLFTSEYSEDFTASKSAVIRNYHSSLHTEIIPDLLVGLDNAEPFHRYLSRIKVKSIHLEGDGYEVVRNISKQFPVNCKTHIGSKQIVIPPTFGMLSLNKYLEELSSAMRMFIPEKLLLRNHDMNPFIKRSPWIGKRNLFFNVFSMGLSALVESGIYFRWEKHEQIQSNLDKGNSSIYNNTNSYAQFLLTDTKISEASSIEVQPVSLKVMRIPFFIWLVLLSICCTICCIEICRRRGFAHACLHSCDTYVNL